jgi:mannosyltransferase
VTQLAGSRPGISGPTPRQPTGGLGPLHGSPPGRSAPTARMPRRSGSLAATVPTLAAIAPALGALGVGWYGLGNRELWNDELITWHATELTTGQLRTMVGNIDLVHVTYYLIVRAAVTVIGDAPDRLRLPSVIAMAVAAALVVLVGRKLVDTAVGFVSATLFATLPVVSRYAQEARSYALVTMAALLATWLLLRALEHPTRRRWALYAAGLVLAGLLHFVALMVLAAHLVLVVTRSRGQDGVGPRLDWAISVGVAMLFFIPLLTLGSRQSGQISWVAGDLEAVKKFPEQLFGAPPVAWLVGTMALFGLVLGLRRHRAPVACLVVWAALPPVLGYVSYTWMHLFLARYFLFVVPAWCLLAAIGVCQMARTLTGDRFYSMWLVGALLAVPAVGYAGLPAQAEVRRPGLDDQPSYSAALAYVRSQARPTDGMAFNDHFGASTDLARKAFRYAFRGTTGPRDVFLYRSADERGWLTATECPDPVTCVGETTRIWLMETGSSGDPFGGLAAPRAALLREEFRVVRTQEFSRLRVYLLQRGAAGTQATPG